MNRMIKDSSYKVRFNQFKFLVWKTEGTGKAS